MVSTLALESLQAQAVAALKTVVADADNRPACLKRDLLNLLDRLGKDNIGFKSLRRGRINRGLPQRLEADVVLAEPIEQVEQVARRAR